MAEFFLQKIKNSKLAFYAVVICPIFVASDK